MTHHGLLRFAALLATAASCLVVSTTADARVDPGPEKIVEAGNNIARYVDVAYNTKTGEYFAVWEDAFPANVAEVRGQRLAADGSPIGASVLVAASGSEIFAGSFAPPQVTYNAAADQFAVVFARSDNFNPVPAQARLGVVVGHLISGQGVPIGAEVKLNPPFGNFSFCLARYPDIVADPATGGYVLAYQRQYATSSAGGQCGGLDPSTGVTVVQALTAGLGQGARTDFPTSVSGLPVPHVGHNPTTGTFMVTQASSGGAGADNRFGRRFEAQIYTSAITPVGSLKVVDVDPIGPSTPGVVSSAIPVADPVTGNWFVVATSFPGSAWTNLLSPTGESLRTGTRIDSGATAFLDDVVAVGDGTFVFSTNRGNVVHVRADGTQIHQSDLLAIRPFIADQFGVALGADGSGLAIAVGATNISARPFDLVAPGALAVPPARVLDTRDGQATVDGVGQGGGKVAGGEFVSLKVAGRGGVPADAEAVFLNVAATGASSRGFVTAYPCDAAVRPTTSNLNYPAGRAASAAAVAKLGDDGTVCLFTSASANLVIDVNGYVPAGGSVAPLAPARLLETRVGSTNVTADGDDQGIGRRTTGQVTPLEVTGRAGIDGDADAVIVSVAAIKPSAQLFVTVYPCDAPERPNTSNLNAAANSVVNNLVMSKVAADGTICIYTSKATDLIVDVAAFVPDNGGLLPIVPARVLETRQGASNTTVDGQSQNIGRISGNAVVTLPVRSRGGVSPDATGVMLNVAAIKPEARGFITMFPCDEDQPTASNLNYAAGDVVANAVLVKLSAAGTVCFFSLSDTDMIVDVVGYTVDT